MNSIALPWLLLVRLVSFVAHYFQSMIVSGARSVRAIKFCNNCKIKNFAKACRNLIIGSLSICSLLSALSNTLGSNIICIHKYVVRFDFVLRIGILLPKLFWPTVRKIVLLIEKYFWNSRLKAKNLQNIWDH